MFAQKRMTSPRRMNAAAPPTMFPHTVTIYNTYTEEDDDRRETTINYITVLRGVFLDASKAYNVRETGMVGADAVDLYIPPTAKATDGETGKPKEYIGPVEFWEQGETGEQIIDRSNFWTLLDSESTFFVKGVVVDYKKDRQAMEMAYDDVYSITKVDVKDFGGLRHIEVGGT